MKILILVKEVPDTASTRVLDPVTGLLDRGASEPVPDEIGERAIDHALRYRESGGDVEIAVLALSPQSSEASIRKFLAVGADAAYVVADPAVTGADGVRTAEILAKAIERIAPDRVIAGTESSDGRGGLIAPMLAELLGRPLLPAQHTNDIQADGVSGTLNVEGESIELRSELPAVVSVTEWSAEPRFPNFKGIMAAKKKPLEFWSLADLGVDSAPGAASVMVSAERRAARGAGVRVVDDGTGAEQLAEYLAANRLI
jgi:electron transfer flavoprotein beta subunit